MANYYRDNDDLKFYLEKGIDWEALFPVTEFRPHPDAPADAAEAQALYRDIAEMVGEFVAAEVTPRAAAIDRKGHQLVDGEVVGHVTVGDWSPTLEAGIGYARFRAPTEGSWLGSGVVVSGASGEFAGEVVELPFFDAEKRLPRGLPLEDGAPAAT